MYSQHRGLVYILIEDPHHDPPGSPQAQKVRSDMDQKPTNTPNPGALMGAWLAIGTGVGAALGAAFNNVGVGVALGAAIGCALGAGLANRGGKANDR